MKPETLAHAQQVAAEAPPLTDRQIAGLSLLLTPPAIQAPRPGKRSKGAA